MLVTIEKTGKPLTASEHGFCWNMRCGGRGVCDSCRVRLVQGIFNVNGQVVKAGAFATYANGCQTVLMSSTGIIDVPERAQLQARGKIALGWQSRPLPKCAGEVVGIDIGTTTLAGVRLVDGEIVAHGTTFNRQAQFGDNVVDRIVYAGRPGGLDELQRAVADCVNDLLREMRVECPLRVVVSANTVMTSLFWGIDPSPIGVAPFTAPVRHFPMKRGWQLGMDVPPETVVLALPAISGYVGGDVTAGLWETELGDRELLVDIGTNCEMVLRVGERLLCTSAPAGPAFEGVGITAGSRAVSGAIDHFDESLNYTTVGQGKPNGLCGSGMIDFLAMGRRTGLLDRFGRLNEAVFPERHTRVDGYRGFAIAPGVAITERDIEQLIKAKAGIFAGLVSLLDAGGLDAGALSRIHLAGGFANYIDLKNAVAMGLLPDVRFTIVGNTSLGCACRVALSPELLSELDAWADKPEDVPLNGIASFEERFLEQLSLP